ncbi:MAG: glutamine-hydrolyzing carbamoyl-phosphate synthase small subunit [Candidatus Margulisbacteria bacterium]|nr:glutamine-hydrolyzing carbamoyl-phosphate synthase small subunit [Candidatus Margulisiibacteriota bacterium]
MKQEKTILVLEDGRYFEGSSFGATGEVIGEVVFNTCMSGYQEVLTDPSYKYQIVCMTYPLIGNYGVNKEDVESNGVQVSGFVVKEYSKSFSNYRADGNLDDYLKSQKVMGIQGIDTRALTSHIRDKGAMLGIISTLETDPKVLQKKLQHAPKMTGMDLVKDVTVSKEYSFSDRSDCNLLAYPDVKTKGKFKVAVYDYGCKRNILRKLNDRGCELRIFPAQKKVQDIIKEYKPDGFFLSNGPGDPAAVSYAIENVKELIKESIPTFGICLGHQIIGLALGAKTFKLKFGHRGGNQPVKNMATGRVEIASQNHGFAIDPDTVDKDTVISHINLNDQTVEGLYHKKYPLFSVQYHPEASPGPHDSDYLFDEFIELMKTR